MELNGAWPAHRGSHAATIRLQMPPRIGAIQFMYILKEKKKFKKIKIHKKKSGKQFPGYTAPPESVTFNSHSVFPEQWRALRLHMSSVLDM